MKNLIFSAIALLFPFIGITQNSGFYDNNNKWDYYYDSRATGIYCASSLAINGDTVLNGKQYRKMYDKQNRIVCCVREDSTRKVFIRVLSNHLLCTLTNPLSGIDTTQDVLLYNFNAQIGDTLSAKKYDSNRRDTITIKTIIRDIQTGFFFGRNRKVFFVTRLYGNSNGGSGSIFEGIGTQEMPLSPLGFPASATEGGLFLTCFNQLTNSSTTCLSATENIENKLKIQVLNNPVNTFISIEISENVSELKEVTLSDISGKLIKRITYNSGRNIQIDASQLSNGVYFIGFISKDAYLSRKIVVAH